MEKLFISEDGKVQGHGAGCLQGCWHGCWLLLQGIAKSTGQVIPTQDAKREGCTHDEPSPTRACMRAAPTSE
ncbi:rCG63571 [Rattus norvegicus]|uniref:RCG63571 n=1 Tax=Rattus norvegicus TaxID=10116 RepID=A6IWD3_RAT|nr:rCG63571 [Rattus norvegicus]